MSTTVDNSTMDSNKKSEKENQAHDRLKKYKSQQYSQDAPQAQGPPSQDIGTKYFDSKFKNIYIFFIE